MTRKADLTAVLREGKRARTKYLDVRAIASPLTHPRVGIVVPKRGRTTVDRNRLKRQLRELVRMHFLPTLAPIDLVILARNETYTASFLELHTDLLSAVNRITQGLQVKGQITSL